MNSKTRNKAITLLLNKGYWGEGIERVITHLDTLSKGRLTLALVAIHREEDVEPAIGQSLHMGIWGNTTEFSVILDHENNDKRYWVYTGGRGSGKSHDIAEVIVRMTFESGNGILFARYYATSVMSSIAPSILKTAERLGLRKFFKITKDKIINISTGSFILFAGLHQSNDSVGSGLKSVEGVNIVMIEEAEDLDSAKAWDRFNKLDDSVRMLEKVNRVCLILNPKNRAGQVYQNFIKEGSRLVEFNGHEVEISTRKDIEHVHCTFHRVKQYLDKGWLLKEQRARYKAEEGKDPDSDRVLGKEEHAIAIEFYANNYIGIFNDFIAGKIFPYYEKVDTFPEGLPEGFGIDFGWGHVTAMVKVAVDLPNHRIYIEGRVFKSGMSQADIADAIMLHVGRTDLIVSETADPRLRIALTVTTERDLIPVNKHEMGVTAQLLRMLDFTIVIVGESAGVKGEFDTYRWSDKLDAKGGKVANKADDKDNSIDAARYILTRLLIDYEVIGKAMAKADPQPPEETEQEQRSKRHAANLKRLQEGRRKRM